MNYTGRPGGRHPKALIQQKSPGPRPQLLTIPPKPVTDDLLHWLDEHRLPEELAAVASKEDQPPPVVTSSVVEFTFSVNPSFRRYRNHPITVPKAQYQSLRSAKLDSGDLAIVYGDRPAVRGQMYSATAGYGLYYQIRFMSDEKSPLFQIPVGERLSIRCSADHQGNRRVDITRMAV